LRYLKALHPTPAAMGTDGREKAVIEMWERRAYDEGLIGAAEVFRNTHAAFKDRSLPGHSEAVPQIQALQPRGRQRLRRFFEMLDRQLADNEFIAGSSFSVADITALCAIAFAKIRAESSIDNDPVNLRRWHEAVSGRPSATE